MRIGTFSWRLSKKWYDLKFAVIKWWDGIHRGPERRQAVREHSQRAYKNKYMTPPPGQDLVMALNLDGKPTTMQLFNETQQEADRWTVHLLVPNDITEEERIKLIADAKKIWSELVEKHKTQ